MQQQQQNELQVTFMDRIEPPDTTTYKVHVCIPAHLFYLLIYLMGSKYSGYARKKPHGDTHPLGFDDIKGDTELIFQFDMLGCEMNAVGLAIYFADDVYDIHLPKKGKTLVPGYECVSMTLNNQQAISSLMDGKQNNAFQPFEESWFDVADHVGKEFQLPNLSSPIYQIQYCYQSETIDPLFAGNEMCLCPIMEMLPSITGCGPDIDQAQVNPIGGSIPLRNNEMGSDFTDSTSFLPNGSCVLWSHVVYYPPMTNKSGTTANGVIHDGSEPLKKSSHGTGMGSNGSVLVESHVKASANDPHSNYHSLETIEAFGPSCSYRCKLCNRELLSYS